MSYDAALADRIRRALPSRATIVEKKMFGGIAFLLDGKMTVGVTGTDLTVRVGPAAHAAALALPHVRPMDFTGRPMAGFVFVGPAGTRTVAAIAVWVEKAIAFAATLPATKKAGRAPSTRAGTR